jgi:hypothetical protein
MNLFQKFILGQLAGWTKWYVLRQLGTLPDWNNAESVRTFLANKKSTLIYLTEQTTTKVDDNFVFYYGLIVDNPVVFDLLHGQIMNGINNKGTVQVPVPEIDETQKIGILAAIRERRAARRSAGLTAGNPVTDDTPESIAAVAITLSVITNIVQIVKLVKEWGKK